MKKLYHKNAVGVLVLGLMGRCGRICQCRQFSKRKIPQKTHSEKAVGVSSTSLWNFNVVGYLFDVNIYPFLNAIFVFIVHTG